ncbi:MAG: (d)CMP kinase [Verrucomicrobiales bacterium]|nr:(d)CMP kinase [Verrucomicrobiota bacterium JB025]
MTPTFHAIAIDGPAASGKSTLARNLAQRLGLIMVNSGAMYRAITWAALQHGIDPADSPAVIALMDKIDIDCGHDGLMSTIAIDGRTLTDELRAEHINSNVSTVAAIPEIRETLVKLQRGYLNHSNVVMEGRDIGSVVFPDTPYKIYIDASESVRNSRRAGDGETDSIAKRDAADSKRKTAPLMVADGATVLDTSGLSIEGVADAAIEILKSQGLTI